MTKIICSLYIDLIETRRLVETPVLVVTLIRNTSDQSNIILFLKVL